MSSHYDLLGVPPTATDREIQRAFRKIALELHPDRHHNDPEKTELFKKKAAAYEVLSHPERRKAYDQKQSGGFTHAASTTAKPHYKTYTEADWQTAATPPRNSPWGTAIPADRTFANFPKRIGTCIAGWSTYTTAHSQPIWSKSLREMLRLNRTDLLKSSLMILAVLLIFGSQFLAEEGWATIVTFGWIFAILFGLKYLNSFLQLYKKNKDKPFSFFNGTKGLALYWQNATKATQGFELAFDRVTDFYLTETEEVNRLNTYITSKTYAFYWYDNQTRKVVYAENSTRYIYDLHTEEERKRELARYNWIREAEKQWTTYLMEQLDTELALHGYVEFQRFHQKKKRFAPFVRLAQDEIGMMQQGRMVYFSTSSIFRVFTKGNALALVVKGPNDRPVTLQFPLTELTNVSFFYHAFERLLGWSLR